MVEPSRIGDLLVERVLGEGGMGRVLLCRDDALDRNVAVKTLLPALLNDPVQGPAMRARFLREARALAKVRSPNVVTVHAVGDDKDVGPYVVMDLLDGDDVLALIKAGGNFGVDEAVRVAAACCNGLAAAHDAGLLHRDVKPANLFVKKNGDVVLTDFGLAKEMPLDTDVKPPGSVDVVPAAQLTQQGVVVGTPAYLAPELARGQAPSVASDLYALGATLFHMLTGRPPFEGEAPLDVLTKAVLDAPPRLSSLRNDAPPHIDDAVARCLQKDPRDRPTNALALQALLLTPTTNAPNTSIASTQLLGTFTEPVASPVPLLSSPQNSLANPLTSTVETTSPGRVSVKTAALTVMMTDISGYTERTSRQSREEAARWLSLHDALLQPVFKAFSGRVVKTIGDAFLVTFSSPTDAVHCGMAVQDRLSQHNVNAAEADRIEVKIALSMGEVRLHKGDIFGEPVNLAARLEGLAKKGEVLFSDAVFATMNQAEVKTEARGTHSFKGISREVHVYAAVPDGAAGGAPIGLLPFGGRALARVRPFSGAGAATSPLQSVVNVAGPLAARARTQLEQRPRAVIGVVVGVVAVVVVLVLLNADGRRDRIENGEAAVVRAEIEKIPEADRSVDDVVDLALALHKDGERKKAWKLLQKPIAAGLDDDDVTDVALEDLADKDDAGAVDALAALKDDKSDDVRGLLDGPYWTRHHALDVLEQKKVATDDERADVGFKDVEEEDCGQRRMGLWLLKRAGRGPRALSAVKALGSNMPANLCMMLEVRGAEDAIAKRK